MIHEENSESSIKTKLCRYFLPFCLNFFTVKVNNKSANKILYSTLCEYYTDIYITWKILYTQNKFNFIPMRSNYL